MTILAVGGELDCFRVRPPDDQVNTRPWMTYLIDGPGFDARFCRGSFSLGAPGFFLDLPPQGSQTIWLHMNWDYHPKFTGYFGNVFVNDPGFVLLHNEVGLVRFRLERDSGTGFIVLLAEVSPNGVDGWTNRIDPIIMHTPTNNPAPGAHTYITVDIRVTLGALIEVYVNGTKLSSFNGAMFTAFTTCNSVFFYQSSGTFSEIIVSDTSTLGMRLFTQERKDPLFNMGGSFGSDWSYYQGYDSSRAVPIDIVMNNYWKTDVPGAGLAFAARPITWTYERTQGANPFDQSKYTLAAVAVSGVMSHVAGGSTHDVRFLLTDGVSEVAVSPDLGLHPDMSGNIPRFQYVWNDSPFSGVAWAYSELSGLGYGVQAL